MSGVTSARATDPARGSAAPIHRVYEPVFSLVVQGEKRCGVGDRLFTCSRGKFLVVSVDPPMMVHISVASTKLPYVALGIRLKPQHVASLLLETAASERAIVEPAGMGISDAYSPDVTTNGRPDQASAAPIVSIGRRSVRPDFAMSEKSCTNALWIAPSEAAAPAVRLSRSSSVPRCTSPPAALSEAADASERASPST